MSLPNKNNFFFGKNINIFDNIKFNKEEIVRTNSISTTETIENDFISEQEIDFNQDFFPHNRSIKFTDFLLDNWKFKVKMHLSNIKKKLIKIQEKKYEIE